MKRIDFKGFYELLCESVKDEKGVYDDIIKYCPSFFKLLCNILNDKRIDWHTKLVIDSALSYFVVPHDIIPEDEHGLIGYVDDIFICAYVLREIKNKVSEKLLTDNWEEKGDILEIVEEVFSGSRKIVGDKYEKILQFIGLRKDKLPTVSIKEGDNKIIERLHHERRELIGLLAYVTRVLYRLPARRQYELLKDYLKSQDQFNEIEKILKIMNENEL